jgi:hypothetical protein
MIDAPRLMKPEKVQRHNRKADGNKKPEDNRDDIDEPLILLVSEAKGLKRGLKSVFEMVRKKHQRNHIKGIVDRTPERLCDDLIHRLAGSSESRRDEKRVNVNHKEDEHKAARPKCHARSQSADLRRPIHFVPPRSHHPIREPHPNTDERMKKKARKQDPLDRSKQRVRSEEFRIGIECLPGILLKQKKVYVEMENEEAAEAKSRQCNEQLPANGGGVEGGYLTH